VAVVQAGEAALGGGAAEAVEGAQRRVLLVLGRPGPSPGAEPGLRQPDEAGEVALPQRLGGLEVAALQGADPVRDGAGVVGRHRSSLRPGGWMRGRRAMPDMIPSRRDPPQRDRPAARGVPPDSWHTRSPSGGKTDRGAHWGPTIRSPGPAWTDPGPRAR